MASSAAPISRVVAALLLTGCTQESAPLASSTPRSGETPVSECADDDLEPNDTLERASALTLESTLTARACLTNDDFFRAESSGLPGRILRVRIDGLEGDGQLRARLINRVSGATFQGQAPSGVQRLEIGVSDDGGDYFLVVGLAGDFRSRRGGRAYTVRVDQLPEATNDCCSLSSGAGCSDASVLSCLCQLDNACCRETYDELCIAEARSACDIRCGDALPDSDCCNASAAPGCAVHEVEECVCQIDPFCCVGGFDENCVHLARNQCQLPCASLTAEGL